MKVVDSRYDPPQIVRSRDLPGTALRWLRAGRRDGLARGEIAVCVARPGGETAYLLRVGRKYELELVRAVRGTKLKPSDLLK